MDTSLGFFGRWVLNFFLFSCHSSNYIHTHTAGWEGYGNPTSFVAAPPLSRQKMPYYLNLDFPLQFLFLFFSFHSCWLFLSIWWCLVVGGEEWWWWWGGFFILLDSVIVFFFLFSFFKVGPFHFGITIVVFWLSGLFGVGSWPNLTEKTCS